MVSDLNAPGAHRARRDRALFFSIRRRNAARCSMNFSRWLPKRKSGSRNPKPVRPPFRPRLEVLEDRLAPATFTVGNTNDSGSGSLRQAILDANLTSALDHIEF